MCVEYGWLFGSSTQRWQGMGGGLEVVEAWWEIVVAWEGLRMEESHRGRSCVVSGLRGGREKKKKRRKKMDWAVGGVEEKRKRSGLWAKMEERKREEMEMRKEKEEVGKEEEKKRERGVKF